MLTNSKKAIFLTKIMNQKTLLLMLFPTIIFFILFRVLPILNMRLAFFEYRARGSWNFVGWRYFDIIFSSPVFMNIISNTLIISLMKYVLLFPAFVAFAILLSELRLDRFRKYVQVVSYLPHFLSWVVIASIWLSALSVNGSANQILSFFGVSPIDFMTDRGMIRWILMLSEAWRGLGWDSIIFYIAIITINPSLYEAAEIDGVGRWGKIRFVILPSLVTPMVTVFILNLGFFLNAGFDQVLNFSNAAVQSTIDILDTYIYRIGIVEGQYSIATAVGLIKGVVGIFLVLGTHFVSKKITGKGVW